MATKRPSAVGESRASRYVTSSFLGHSRPSGRYQSMRTFPLYRNWQPSSTPLRLVLS